MQLKSPEECARFFSDLCTVRELRDLAQRLQVAKMLTEGIHYKTIGDETGVSSATISRVNQSLEYGTGGYTAILDRLARK